MEPKDLKNPSRVKSTGKAEKAKSGKAADNEEQVEVKKMTGSGIQENEPEVKEVPEEIQASDGSDPMGESTAGETVLSESAGEEEVPDDDPVQLVETKAGVMAEPEEGVDDESVAEKVAEVPVVEEVVGEPVAEEAAEVPVAEEVAEESVAEEAAEVPVAEDKEELQPLSDDVIVQEAEGHAGLHREQEPEATSVLAAEEEDANVEKGEAGDKQEKDTAGMSAQEELPVRPVTEKESAEDEQAAAALAHKEKAGGKQPAQENEMPDYSAFSQIELVNALRKLLESNGDHDIKDDVETIKNLFYKQLQDEIDAQKNAFIEDGGNEEEFEPEENPYEQDIKELLKKYRQVRHEFNKKLDLEKETNLLVKYDIIEEIKGLIHKEESINKTFQEFRDLQQRWREIGLVPQAKMKDLWDTYHFHVENFYDYIKINKELRDLDLKKNLEMKIRLCEQAEELLLESNTVKAFNQLQKLHERWREIGPVPRENKDDIWERFKASTAKINKKHQDYFESRKTEQRENLEAKRALCEQVEEIIKTELATHRDWSEKSKEVVNLQKVWRTIGFAPRKDNNKIYKRFREACDSFFDAKRDFYSKNKELQQNNMQIKMDLCMQAEALKDSTDWHKTTQDLINIQKQWKDTGPVPRKNSDMLWKRFRAACDYFFEKKSEHFSHIDTEQDDNLKLKEQIIMDIENYKASEDADRNLLALKDFQRRWTEIGHVPLRKKDEIQKKYREAINKLFDDLNLDESKRNLLKFRTKIATFSESSHGQNKMRLERDKYMTRMKQLESDLVLLDNNIGFFAKSKNAETLIRDVKRKIEQTREKIEMLKDKIRVIDEMDQSEE